MDRTLEPEWTRIGVPSDDLATLYQLTDGLYRANSYPEIFDAALTAITAALGERASILLFDEQGVMRFKAWRGLSDAYRASLEGHSPWTPRDIAPAPIFVQDIAESDEPAAVRETIMAEGIRGLAFIPLLSRRRVIGKFMSYYREPHSFTSRELGLAITISRQLGFCLERKWAEDELRESEQRFRLLSEDAPVMLWMSDQNGHCLHLNRLLRAFWGVEEVGLETFDWTSTMHEDDRPVIASAMQEAIASRSPVTVEGRYRDHKGAYRLLSTRAQPRFSPSGAFMGMIGVNVDVTRQRESERELRMLLAELNHRVKNTLAVVQAIARRTFRGVEDEGARQAFEGRLIALSGAHELLTRSHWESASLTDLAASAFRSQGVDPRRISLEGPSVDLSPRQALALALALHELGTNALKYGALSNDRGQVAVHWRRDDDDRLEIAWTETDGPQVLPRARRGFGSALIEQLLARDLDALVTLDFEPSGVRCRIVLATAPETGEETQ